jgi:Lrp/AsnC family transcriptional regulator
MNEEIDACDRKILTAMQAAPDLTTAELAEHVGLSQTPCWRRLKRLEADGIIARRAVLLDPARLGYPVNIFAHVRIARHDEETLEAFEAEVLSHPQIVECFSMSGESDYIMRIIARSIEDYERFLKKGLLHLPGVTAVNSSFALKPVKITTDVPV